MNKNSNLAIIFSAIILGFSIITCSYIVTQSNIKNEVESSHEYVDDILSLDDAAVYLKMEKEEVLKIILMEQYELSQTGSFSGEMFPYFMVDDNYYISKDGLKRWLENVTQERRVYNTDTNTIF